MEVQTWWVAQFSGLCLGVVGHQPVFRPVVEKVVVCPLAFAGRELRRPGVRQALFSGPCCNQPFVRLVVGCPGSDW